jgi:hypothetical protein
LIAAQCNGAEGLTQKLNLIGVENDLNDSDRVIE